MVLRTGGIQRAFTVLLAVMGCMPVLLAWCPAGALEPDGEGRVVAFWSPDPTGATDGLIIDGGTTIGYVLDGAAYVYGNGPTPPAEEPISTIGVTHLRDTGGNLYAVILVTGVLLPEEEEDEEEGSAGILGITGIVGNPGVLGTPGGVAGNPGGPGGPGGPGSPPSDPGGEDPPADPGSGGSEENGSGVQAEFNCRLGSQLFGACKSGAPSAREATARNLAGTVAREHSSTRPHSLIDAFDGWSQLYNGAEKSTITVDPNPIDEAHPNLFLSEEDADRPSMPKAYGWTEKMKIATSDLGVDDEVLKTAMTVYQPVERLQYDFLNDMRLTDGYLDSGKTVRGVAIMTMGFLDKTVGAGLTAVQQQADQNTVQSLLKQISWSADKMANPDRAQSYRDTDEKVEACLELALKDGVPKREISKTTRKWVSFNCPSYCGTYQRPPGDRKYREGTLDWEKLGSGAYSYCTCCAQATARLNYLNQERAQPSPKNGATPRQFSLIHRILFGTMKKLRAGKEGEKTEKLASEVIRLYGDYVLHEQQGGDGSGGAAAPVTRDNGMRARLGGLGDLGSIGNLPGVGDLSGLGELPGIGDLPDADDLAGLGSLPGGGSTGQIGGAATSFDFYHRWQYVPPRYSVQRYTAALRNGCRYCKDPDCDIVAADADANCPITDDMGMKFGICPALGYIFKNWNRINAAKPSARTADDVKAWMEASMGHVLTGRSISTMCALNGNSAECPSGALGGPMKRFVDAFCDSSSVAAFTRYHSRLSAIMLDHLALNRQVTSQDKAAVLSLINRVAEQLALTQADEAANYAVEANLSGLSIAMDRRTVGQIASATAGAIEGWNDVASLNQETSKFGAFASGYFGPGSAAGAGAATAREGYAADTLIRSEVNTLSAPSAVTDVYGRIGSGLARMTSH